MVFRVFIIFFLKLKLLFRLYAYVDKNKFNLLK